MPDIIGGLPLLLAAAGIGYTVHALLAIGRLCRRPPDLSVAPEPVTLLKPLHGPEPRLAANLATFLNQDWLASVQMVAGVGDPADSAIAVATALPQGPWRAVTAVVDRTVHGANAKVGNLVNMLPAAEHDLLVLSDSDISVAPDYLARIAAALARPGIGAVTCLYRGRGDAGRWSVLAAAAVSYNFLPSVVVSLSLGDARVCMGSTIALRRETLDAIGGFAPFADVLADDHAIGAAVRGLGLGRKVAVPSMLLVHASTEQSLSALLRHELRWAATVRDVVSVAEYAGLLLTQPVAPALLACVFLPRAGLVTLVAALVARVLMWWRVDRWAGAPTAPLWMLPIRDLLSFGVFLASFGVRRVDWRGARLTLTQRGRIAPGSELPQ